MQIKKIVIASDHGGFLLKEAIKQYLHEKGYMVTDYGPRQEGEAVDYPDKADLVARGIFRREGNLGFLICTSGIGMSIAVNRYPFVRGALVTNAKLAEMARAHNNANVLIFGEKYITPEEAIKAVDAFLTTSFEGGRHERRVNKLQEMPYNI